MGNQALGDALSGFLPCPTPTKGFQTNMQYTIEKSTIGKHHTLGAYLASKGGFNPNSLVALYEYFCNHFLKKIKVRKLFQLQAPSLREAHTVALGTRTPHGRPFGFVKHLELNGGLVSDNAHIAPQCIDLTDYLPLGNASYCGITGHLCHVLQLHGNK